MNSETKSQNDQAWVTIDIPLPLEEVKEFCQDVERLFRINPLLEFSICRSVNDEQLYLQGKNLSNAQAFDIELRREIITDGFKLHYKTGLKRSTSITVTAVDDGSQLKIMDDYSGTSEDERNERLNEVDKSLQAWGGAIRSYLKSWKRWSGFPLWPWYMRRVWLPMKPSARRITSMLIAITALEFVAFLMVFTIFWLELDKFFEL